MRIRRFPGGTDEGRVVQTEAEARRDLRLTADDAHAQPAQGRREGDIVGAGRELPEMPVSSKIQMLVGSWRSMPKARERSRDPSAWSPALPEMFEHIRQGQIQADGQGLGEAGFEVEIEAQDPVAAFIDEAEIQEVARLGDPEGLLQLGLQELDRAGRVALHLVQGRGKLVGEGEQVVDAHVDERDLLVQEPEGLELLQEAHQGAQGRHDVGKTDVVEADEILEAGRGDVDVRCHTVEEVPRSLMVMVTVGLAVLIMGRAGSRLTPRVNAAAPLQGRGLNEGVDVVPGCRSVPSG